MGGLLVSKTLVKEWSLLFTCFTSCFRCISYQQLLIRLFITMGLLLLVCIK